MARPPLPLGTWGNITTSQVRPGVYRSWARYRDHDGQTRQVTATGTTRAAAQRALREILSERLAPAGELVHAEMRLSELAEFWLTYLEDEGRIEQSTINEYGRVVTTTVLPALGGLRIREATTGRLDRFLLALSKESANRQRKARAVLGAMLDVAVRHDAIAVNPVRATSRLHRRKGEARTLRPDDLTTIRAAIKAWMSQQRPGPKPTSDMADIVELMLATGCRIGEILALRWEDIDLDVATPTLTVAGTIKTEKGRGTYRKATPKSDSSRRTVVLPAFAVELLSRRKADRALNLHDAVFATRNGTWHQVGNIERRWRQIRKDAGLTWVTPHTYRKTVATLVSEKVDSDTAAQQLGHSSATITKEFYIAKPAVAADVSDVLQSFAAEAPPRPDRPGT